jgi:hypothetical protein
MPKETPVEIDPNDRSVLEKIGRLRIQAWETVPKGGPTDCWLDEFELVSRHWAIFHDREPVAAARLSVHLSLNEVPDAGVYAQSTLTNLPTPIGSINRLITHPAFRRRGFSLALDAVRVAAADAMGCRCIVVNTPTGPTRVRQLLLLGFELVGLPVVMPADDVVAAGMYTQILIRFLHKTNAGGQSVR